MYSLIVFPNSHKVLTKCDICCQPDGLTQSVTGEEILKFDLSDAYDAADLMGDQLAARDPSPNGTDRNIKDLGNGTDRVEFRFPI
jgi:hypothetical protein